MLSAAKEDECTAAQVAGQDCAQGVRRQASAFGDFGNGQAGCHWEGF